MNVFRVSLGLDVFAGGNEALFCALTALPMRTMQMTTSSAVLELAIPMRLAPEDFRKDVMNGAFICKTDGCGSHHQNNTAKCSLHICLDMDFPTGEIHCANAPALPCVDPRVILGRREQFDVLTEICDWFAGAR